MSKIKLIAEPGKQEIVITRVFDAPRNLVFETYINPDVIPKWWGPSKYVTTVDKMEVRTGGIWRYVQRAKEEDEFAFHGVYHAIVAPERLVFTFEFEGMPGHVLLETVTFEDNNGKTLMTDRMVFQTVEDRDGMLGSGMEAGLTEALDRFEQQLQTLV
ncbi:MAG: SRPBCC family protein [Chloroflexi bacterium]|uniref:SRPBCC family protein n=1 Tax=Candidatus Chlorohelix allophototropha TaxID=3003348 RepID=A0A8T7M8H3_9CHLR|nr:SRPBCC family protein [Chloroflexota bacterium]WJW68260.1 SRPBCC family protein [Chloroflexota bacterium L227-S17]